MQTEGKLKKNKNTRIKSGLRYSWRLICIFFSNIYCQSQYMHQIGQNTDPKLIIFSHLERYCMYFLKNQYCAVRIEVAPEIWYSNERGQNPLVLLFSIQLKEYPFHARKIWPIDAQRWKLKFCWSTSRKSKKEENMPRNVIMYPYEIDDATTSL